MRTTPCYHAALHAHRAYRQLQYYKYNPTRPAGQRVKRPAFTSRTPSPDGDWALTIECDLLRDNPDSTIPSGLYRHAVRALAPHAYPIPHDGLEITALLCVHHHSVDLEYEDRDRLIELLNHQAHYIHQCINAEYGSCDERKVCERPRHRAATVIMLAAQHGATITRNDLKNWVKRGKIRAVTTPQGHNTYDLQEILAHTQHCPTNAHTPLPAMTPPVL